MIIGRGGHYRQLIAEGCDPDANLIAIGHCGDRERETNRHGGPFDIFVSAKATLYVASVACGEGSQVMGGAVIHSPLGRHCIVGNNAVVSHDVKCEDYVFIGPGAVVTGYCVLRRGCFIGAGAIVTPRTEVPAGMMLKAGARMSANHHGSGWHTAPTGSLIVPGPGTP